MIHCQLCDFSEKRAKYCVKQRGFNGREGRITNQHDVTSYIIGTAIKHIKQTNIMTYFKKWVALKRAVVDIQQKTNNLFGLLGFLGQKDGLDVGQDTSLGDGDTAEQFVQFLVVPDGELEMTGDDPALLVVTGGVSCQLENLSCQVFHDGSQVDGGTGTNSLGIVALSQQTVDSANGELKSSPAAARLALALCFSSFTTSRHDDVYSTTVRNRMKQKQAS